MFLTLKWPCFFLGKDGDEEQEESTNQKKFKSMKNPNVDTSFLPDKEREEQERRERDVLKLEWLKQQEKIKS
jgi:protein FAM50